jgi:hypothetical protein
MLKLHLGGFGPMVEPSRTWGAVRKVELNTENGQEASVPAHPTSLGQVPV